MAQANDYTIDNSTGANVRADINTVLQAIATNNSGSSAASTTFASGFFANTSTSMMQLRNTSNNAFLDLFTLAGGPAFPIDGTINSISIGKGANSVAGNTVLGESALDASVSGGNNTAVGKNALSALTSGTQNVAIGAFCLDATTTANNNTAIGMSCLGTNTTGTGNVGMGRNALLSNTTGSSNTGLGTNALQSNTEADNNVGVGLNALVVNTTGTENVAVGALALDASTTGIGGTAVGFEALTASTGDNNTALGRESGDNVTSGSNNSLIGYKAQASSATVSNEITLGDANITALRCQVALTVLSDRRDKTNIVDLSTGLDFINLLKPRKFEWKTREGVKTKDGTVRAGFIAQELQEAQKGSEYLNLVYESNPEKLEATYGNLIPVLVKAVQELSTKVTALEAG
tara:strand:+ start:100 stop:1314 length:1215 start_codon:yes stop_codon:yes gene_type:complete